jgi:hypothetical protein
MNRLKLDEVPEMAIFREELRRREAGASPKNNANPAKLATAGLTGIRSKPDNLSEV